jgi:NitT/TauT family transport system ATP-binding protein
MTPVLDSPFLNLQGVSYTYPGWPPVVQGVDWRLARGAFHSLVGRSGCGKTTLLKLAAGLLQPDSGGVWLDGQAVTQPSPVAGFVFQSPTLLDWLTIWDNVLLPAQLRGKASGKLSGHDGQKVRDKAASLLEAMGLSAYAQQYPHQLSGGQQSRVAIARALVLDPAVLLMDEPFAALDAITREELQLELLNLCRRQNSTVMFVTHDITEAVFLADRVAVMDRGVMTRDVPIDLPRPRTSAMRYSAEFNQLCAQLRAAMDAGAP